MALPTNIFAQQPSLGAPQMDGEFLGFLDQLNQRLNREAILPGFQLQTSGPDFGPGAPPSAISPTQLPSEIPLGSELQIQDPVGVLGDTAKGGFGASLKASASSPLFAATALANLASTDFEDPASIGQGVGGTLGGLVGSALIPIPFVGGAIGSTAGQFLGAEVGGLFGKSKAEEDEEEAEEERKRAQTQDSLRNAAIFFQRSNARRGIPQFF